jgi:hypothetical protein
MSPSYPAEQCWPQTEWAYPTTDTSRSHLICFTRTPYHPDQSKQPHYHPRRSHQHGPLTPSGRSSRHHSRRNRKLTSPTTTCSENATDKQPWHPITQTSWQRRLRTQWSLCTQGSSQSSLTDGRLMYRRLGPSL